MYFMNHLIWTSELKNVLSSRPEVFFYFSSSSKKTPKSTSFIFQAISMAVQRGNVKLLTWNTKPKQTQVSYKKFDINNMFQVNGKYVNI